MRQLLDFSHKEPARAALLDLNELAGSSVEWFRRTILEDVEVDFTPCAVPLWVFGDADQLNQVIVNLAGNARDGMPRGGVLSIETSLADVSRGAASPFLSLAPGKYAQLTVHDTGHGMGPETLERAFEPFFTTKTKGLGTGLGLAIVYSIIKQHGGAISVTSDPGQGTTFKILIATAEEGVVEAGQGATQEGAGAPCGTESILLVEDNISVRNLTRALLERLGYVVITAENGRTALRILDERGGPVDLVLTDVVMPEMNGPDLVAELAAAYPHMRTLFMSGYAGGALQGGEGLAPGACFLQKPFTIEALSRGVREALDS